MATDETWQRRYENGERAICPDRIRTIRQFAIEDDNSVPATVKSQVAAEAEDAIPNCAVVGNEAQRPHLRVKNAIRVGCFYVVNARLQESDQRRILGRQFNLPALAEDRESIPIAP